MSLKIRPRPAVPDRRDLRPDGRDARRLFDRDDVRRDLEGETTRRRNDDRPRHVFFASLVAAFPRRAPRWPADNRRISRGRRSSPAGIDLSQEDLRLFLRDSEGAILRQFSIARSSKPCPPRQAAGEGVAMNAGMFHRDRRAPWGSLRVEKRHRGDAGRHGGRAGQFRPAAQRRVVPDRRPPARIVEAAATASRTRRPAAMPPSRGPMLVIDGDHGIRGHSRRGQPTTSATAVGVEEDGRIVHPSSPTMPFNFHHFARFFRDHPGVPDAPLFRPGRSSRLYRAGDRGRADIGRRSGRSSARW